MEYTPGLLQVRGWGQNPIFNFDGSDKENIFLMNTFPNLVDQLYDVTNAVKDGTKVTKAYVKALPQFER